MSKQVDERVVEMRFDNTNFESNVKTTMSTLDRLKAALKFPSKTDALSGIAKSAENAASGLSATNAAVGTLRTSFSALQVVGVTALANITNQAVNAGKQLVNALTLQPVMSGFNEYETQLNSIQTILSNTRSKGSTIEDVTAALDELNKYADQTIYNFTEMTRNIGTFTAAGVGLDESVQAIKGIANLAAMSGSTSAQASTAMYQLSQALATGRVSLMDWNSVVNAGMGGEVFQTALKRTAENMGKDVDGLIEKYGSFRESLTQGEWLTADVLTETLAQIAGAYDESTLLAQGYTKDQAAAILDLAQNATDAATKVTTFTKLLDTLGEALGSGWTNTWEAIFGDFYTAQDFWTGISNTLGDMITKSADARNELISGAFDSPWEKVEEQISETGVSFDTFQEKIKEVAREHGIAVDDMISEQGSLQKVVESGAIGPDILIEAFGRLADSMTGSTAATEDATEQLQKFQDIVDRVWRGDFGNGADRIDALTKAGWDYNQVQSLVNKTVDGHRLTLEDLSDEQLKSVGYTEEQITALRELADQAAETGTPLNELIQRMSKPSGRELFFESIKNILQAIIKPAQAVAEAFNDVFSIDSGGIYDLLEAFNKFSSSIIMNDDTLDRFKRTIRGVFSIIEIVTKLVSGALTSAFEFFSPIVGDTAFNVLDLTANVGDAIYNFSQWLDTVDPLAEVFARLSEAISNFVGWVQSLSGVQKISKWFSEVVDWVERLFTLIDRYKNHEIDWDEFLGGIRGLGDQFRKQFSKLGDIFVEIGHNIIDGLVNGVTESATNFIEDFLDFFEKAVEVVKAFLGIHSPSTVFFEIGVNIIEGLVNGIKYVSGTVIDTLAWLIDRIKGLFEGVDWGAVLAIGAGVGSFVILWQFTKALQGFASAAQNFTDPFGRLGQVFANFATIEKSFSKYLDAKKWTVRAEAIKTLAISLGILTVAIIAIANQDIEKIWDAVRVLGVLAAIMAGLTVVINLFSGASAGDTIKLGGTLAALSIALVSFAAIMSILSSLDPSGAQRALDAIGSFSLCIVAIVGMTQVMGKAKQVASMAALLSSVGVALILMAATVKILGGMDASQLQQGIDAISMFSLIIMALMGMTQVMGTGDISSLSSMLKSVAVAFILMSAATAILGKMDAHTLGQGMFAITYFTLIVAGLMAATRLVGGKQLGNIGTTILAVSGAFTLMAIACAVIGTMDEQTLNKGVKYIAIFSAIITAMIGILRFAGGGQIAKVGATIFAMSLSIGILAGISVLLGYVKEENLAKGIACVGAFSVMVSLMAAATRGASDVKGTMIGIAVAIGVLAASVAILSFIEPQRLYSAVGALSAVMIALSVLTNSVGWLGETNKKQLASVGVLIGMVVALTGVITLLAGIDSTNALPNAIALSSLIAALGVAMKFMGTIQEASLGSVGTLAAMTAVIYGLVGVIAILQAINPQNVLPNTVALSSLLLALSGAIRIMGDMKGINIVGVGAVLAEVTVAMYALTGVLAILSTIDPTNALPNVINLGILLGEMTAVTFALSKMGAVDPVAVAKAAVALDAVTAIIGALVTIVGAINQITQGGLATSIASGGEVLEELGNAIGSFIGGLLGGVAEGVMGGIADELPDFGLALSQFMTNLTPFLIGLKMVTPDMLTSAQNLSDAILKLAGASLIEAISRFLGGGINWADLGTQMGYLGGALGNFVTSIGDVDLSKAEPASNAIQKITTAMSQIPSEGGLLGAILGGKNYEGFATSMESIAKGLSAFVTNVGEINGDTVQPAADALNTIITTMSSIPAEGGILGAIIGGTYDYQKFADGMEGIGQGLFNFVDQVSQIGDYTIVGTAAEALNTLITTMSSIPQEGGWLDMIFGDGSIDYSKFSQGLKGIGDALKSYSDSVTEVNFEQVATATTKVKDVIDLMAAHTGDSSDLSFGIENIRKIEEVGTIINNFYNNMGDVDPTSISNAVNSIRNLVNVINEMASMDVSGVDTFKNAVEKLAQVDVTAIKNAFEAIDLSSVGSNLSQTLANGMMNNTSAVTNAAKSVATAAKLMLIVSSIQLSDVGKTYIGNFGKGIIAGFPSVSSALRLVVTMASAVLNSYSNAFYSAGLNLAYGFARGISSGSYAAKIAAMAMANAAANAAAKALDEHSPSKVLYHIGEYGVLGFVNAFVDYFKVAANAGTDMAKAAYNGVEKATSGFNGIFDNLDANPTITPVMDLSEIKSGVNYINSALSGNANYSVFGQVNRIARGVNSSSQNGTTKDVIRELSKLRGDIQSMPVNQYSIDGITYDDGSAVSGAVGQLIRAVRLERRI